MIIKLDNGVCLSIEVGEDRYCEPMVGGLAFEDYDAFEVFMYYKDKAGFCTELFPSDFGLDELMKTWVDYIGTFVALNDVLRLRDTVKEADEEEVRSVVYSRRKENGYLDR